MTNDKFENESSEQDFLSLVPQSQESFIHVIFRYRKVVLFSTIFFLFFAIAYLIIATPIYISKSDLYVEQSGPKIIDEFEGVMTRSKNYLYTQKRLITSTPVLEEVAENPELKNLEIFRNIDNITGYLKHYLEIEIGRNDDIISISFGTPYPKESSLVVNKVVDSYINYHSKRKQTTASVILKILRTEKKKRDEELDSKFKQMLEFTRNNGVVSFDDQGGNVVYHTLSTLSDALTTAQLATINAKADYEATLSLMNEPSKVRQLAATSSTSGVRVFINDIESELRNDLRETEIKLENTKYRVTEEHPSVKALQTKLDYIKQELENHSREFAESYLEVVKLKWRTAQKKEKELQQSFNKRYEEAQDLGAKATEYTILQSELKRAERICEILDNRIKELDITEDTGALNISILEVARPSMKPAKPQKAKVLLIALLIGITFGSSLALLRDSLDFTLRSIDEITVFLGLPVLGAIPSVSKGEASTRKYNFWTDFKFVIADIYQKIRFFVTSEQKSGDPFDDTQLTSTQIMRADFDAVCRKISDLIYKIFKKKVVIVKRTSLDKSDAGDDIDKRAVVNFGQIVHLEPKSVIAEAYRTVRTAIFFGVPKGKARTILVTSPSSGDGKSTLASNLGITMAQAGQKTLILDADFRKPIQHNIFGLNGDNTKGISDVFADVVSLEEAILSGPCENIDILPCGKEIPNPSELLNSDEFEQLLRILSEKYDRVIVDSPPVGPVADSQILSVLCDITVMLLRAEKSTRRHSQQVCDSLNRIGGHLIGVVVNDVQQHGGYGYYSHYGHYGYYGSKSFKK